MSKTLDRGFSDMAYACQEVLSFFWPGTVILEPAVLSPVHIGRAGIGRLPDFCAADTFASGTITRLLPEHQFDSVDVHALHTSHRSLSAKILAFIDTLDGTSEPNRITAEVCLGSSILRTVLPRLSHGGTSGPSSEAEAQTNILR